MEIGDAKNGEKQGKRDGYKEGNRADMCVEGEGEGRGGRK